MYVLAVPFLTSRQTRGFLLHYTLLSECFPIPRTSIFVQLGATHEHLGNNRLSSRTTRTAQKTTIQTLLSCLENVLCDLLPSNERGYTDRCTETTVRQFLYCCVYSSSWEIITEPLPSKWEEAHSIPSFCRVTIIRILVHSDRKKGLMRAPLSWARVTWYTKILKQFGGGGFRSSMREVHRYTDRWWYNESWLSP
jgi:hypothetical protein